MTDKTHADAAPHVRATLDAARDSVAEVITERSRAFDMTLDIDASPAEVWRALTEAEELVRWFPLQAAVTMGPGEQPAGGTMAWTWPAEQPWVHRIDEWEPLKRLRLVQPPRAGESRPERAGAAPVALEFTLDTHEGGTRLRMVHSGFGFGGSWDDEFDGIKSGWQYELRSLRHYLERHRGRPRQFGLARAHTALPLPAAWARLVSAEGFGLHTSSDTGGAFTVEAATSDRFSGSNSLLLADEFAGAIPALHDALLRLAVHKERGGTGLMVGLSSYAPEDADAVDGFITRATTLLRRLFPS